MTSDREMGACWHSACSPSCRMQVARGAGMERKPLAASCIDGGRKEGV